jgi:SAM-dependent methyltransferase
MDKKNYWNKRFQDEGYVWGTAPSQTAEYAAAIFRKNGVKKVLVPGSGYGRNTKFFNESGFAVTGIEISDIACEMAGDYDPGTTHYQGSVTDMACVDGNFDAVYSFNVMHLLEEAEREKFIQQCNDKINDGGLLFFTAFSDYDPSRGRGKKLAENTFESRPGRPAHYFSEETFLHYFRNFEVLETGIVEDPENHGEGPHTHVLRYILGRKPKSE